MRFIVIILFFGWIGSISGQSPYILPGTLSDEIADRWDILFNFDHSVFSGQRNTSRKELSKRAHQLLQSGNLSKHDQIDLKYILTDNNEYNDEFFKMDEGLKTVDSFDHKVFDSTGVFYYIEKEVGLKKVFTDKRKPVFSYLYKTRGNFFEVNKENFTMKVNPILNIKYGQAKGDDNIIFQNTRGVEIRGLIDSKVYFHTSILENQARFNNYIERRIDKFKAIPGQGFFKKYNSGVFENLNGHDFANSQAYVGINATKSVAIEFGHGNHFIGHGIRSLLLSNTGHNYFYLKFNTRIWKFHYQNIFAELAPISSGFNPGNKLLPKKYMANHYLSFRPNKNIEIGLFETVIFSREDHFEFQYLNPVILYRTVEQFLDSPDNVLIGLMGKWNIKNKIQIYGQVMLDEFKLDEIISGDGWWANKYGLQMGAKVINIFGVDHLDVQIEYNSVRPYTYTHRDSLSNFPTQSTASYSHFNQPLAHPLGANFKEVIAHIKYRPFDKLYLNTRIIKTKLGQNPNGQNLGGDILLISGSREADFGNITGQGIATDIFSFGIDLSYQVAHNYFLDLNFLTRKSDAEQDDLDVNTTYIGGGLRVNLGNIQLDY